MLAAAASGMERAKGTGRLTDGRERFLRAMMDVSFDGPGWLAQFQGDAAALQRVVLAVAPVTAPPAGMQGMDLIRHLTIDPVYQLK
jgi:hypothetical protein